MSLSIHEIMSNDHRYCDELFIPITEAVQSNDWNTAQLKLELLINDINFHFDYEEDTLFPFFEEESGSTNGPSSVMRHEHTEIRSMLSQIKTALSDNDINHYYALFDTLNIFIQQHNMKEENILYPMIDTMSKNKSILLEKMLQRMTQRNVA